MNNFWPGFWVGHLVSSRDGHNFLGFCLIALVGGVALSQCSHARATKTATQDRPPSVQLHNPPISARDVLDDLAPYGNCSLRLIYALPPPAEGQPVINPNRFEERAVKAGTILRQYDTDADQFRRVEVRIDHSADNLRVAGVVRAAYTRTEAMTVVTRHGRQVYHKAHGWRCEKAEFSPDLTRAAN